MSVLLPAGAESSRRALGVPQRVFEPGEPASQRPHRTGGGSHHRCVYGHCVSDVKAWNGARAAIDQRAQSTEAYYDI